MKKIAINGLGRIGRLIVRNLLSDNYPNLTLAAVNSPGKIENLLHLIEYDSIHGFFKLDYKIDGDFIIIKDKNILVTHEKKIENLLWKKHNIDLILDCTGKFTNKIAANGYIEAGIKKVLISAPAKDSDHTIIYGVNDQNLTKEMQIISAGSCTTNALAPLAKLLNDNIGIEYGFMTTIHAYTNDQNILDSSHNDLRRARAANLSMIPTTTGAADSIGLVIPELKGKLAGAAIRVPTANVSLIDFTFTAKSYVTKEGINELVYKASQTSYKNIISVAPAPLVSIDFNHTDYSAIFDPYETRVIDNKLVRILAWYDNEWGFTCRMLDIANLWCGLD